MLPTQLYSHTLLSLNLEARSLVSNCNSIEAQLGNRAMTKRNNSAAVSASLIASQAHAPRGEEEEASSPASTNTLQSDAELTPNSQESEPLSMNASDVLTQGALRQITDGVQIDSPVVQCVQIKPMASQNGVERFRVVMSDSINFMQGMLGQRMSALSPSHVATLTITRRTQLRHPRW